MPAENTLDLEDNVRKAQQAREVGLYEAAAFYAARILGEEIGNGFKITTLISLAENSIASLSVQLLIRCFEPINKQGITIDFIKVQTSRFQNRP